MGSVFVAKHNRWYTVGGIENCGYKQLNYFTSSTCRI
jgi:hypothetical protein